MVDLFFLSKDDTTSRLSRSNFPVPLIHSLITQRLLEVKFYFTCASLESVDLLYVYPGGEAQAYQYHTPRFLAVVRLRSSLRPLFATLSGRENVTVLDLAWVVTELKAWVKSLLFFCFSGDKIEFKNFNNRFSKSYFKFLFENGVFSKLKNDSTDLC